MLMQSYLPETSRLRLELYPKAALLTSVVRSLYKFVALRYK